MAALTEWKVPLRLVSMTSSHCSDRHVFQPRGRKNSGIGAEHVYPAIFRGNGFQRCFHAGERSHIAAQAKGPVADFGGAGIGILQAPGKNGNLCASPGKDPGNALADAFGAPGHHNGTAFERCGHMIYSLVIQ